MHLRPYCTQPTVCLYYIGTPCCTFIFFSDSVPVFVVVAAGAATVVVVFKQIIKTDKEETHNVFS